MVIRKIKAEELPQVGDYKFRKRFALFPKKINSVVVWLEYYTEVYEYRNAKRYIHYPIIVCIGVHPSWDLIALQRK